MKTHALSLLGTTRLLSRSDRWTRTLLARRSQSVFLTEDDRQSDTLADEFEFMNVESSQVTFLWLANKWILAYNISLIFNSKLQRLMSLFDKLLKRRFIVSVHDLILAQY